MFKLTYYTAQYFDDCDDVKHHYHEETYDTREEAEEAYVSACSFEGLNAKITENNTTDINLDDLIRRAEEYSTALMVLVPNYGFALKGLAEDLREYSILNKKQEVI